MIFGSLFSGIGGLDLGLERAGMECAWQVEIDPFCRKVLAKHWPHVRKFGDIKELTGYELGPVDLVAGGFPCPPVSQAGQRKAQADPRWLWPDFARVLRVVRPRLALLENVPGLLTANGGSAFNDVLSDLAAIGYDAEWDCIPAAAVGAPHLRDRIFIVAYTNGVGSLHGEPQGLTTEAGIEALGDVGAGRDARQIRRPSGDVSTLPTPNGERPQGRGLSEREERQAVPYLDGGGSRGFRQTARPSGEWIREPDIHRVVDGVPSELDTARLKAYGNAVVPQVAEFIGLRIMEVAA